jgi:hypothetical protein
MSNRPEGTLEFLAREHAELLAAMAKQRADIAALSSVTRRLDASFSDLLSEVRILRSLIEHHGHLPFDAFDQMDKTERHTETPVAIVPSRPA